MRNLALPALLAASVLSQPIAAQTSTEPTPPASATTPAPAAPTAPSPAAPTTPAPAAPTAPAPPPSASPAPPPSAGPTATPMPPAGGAQPSVATPVPPAAPPTQTREMSVAMLKDKDLVGANSGELGDIERVVESNADKKRFLVVSRGGFLGLFETDVLVPLDNVAVRNDQVVARNLTEEQLKALPKFDSDDNAYRAVEDNQNITLTEMR